jgi:hypothetical protein
MSVTEQRDEASGRESLQKFGVPELLRQHLEALNSTVAEVDEQRVPSSVIAGNYQYLVFAHVAWILGEIENGEKFVALATRPDVCKLGTLFWAEYGAAMQACVFQESYQVPSLRTRGQETYWVGYMRFIEAALAGTSMTSHIQELAQLFANRNKDSTIRDDAYEIEGSASLPARWDFRRLGLTSYLEHRPT